MRNPAKAAALLALALWVRVGWLPVGRHRFDGHEADLLAAFQGSEVATSTRVHPVAASLAAGLGRLSQDPRLLLAVSVLAGLVCVGAAGLWAQRRWGPSAGFWTALLVALTPAQAFWSTSAYPVILPQAFLLGGLAIGGWRGALFYGAACALRPELVAVAPALVLLGERRLVPGVLGAVAILPVWGTAPALRSPLVTLPVNLPLVDFLGPLATGAAPLLLLLALKGDRWRLLAAALWVHLCGSVFDDYGTRHALFGGVCLAVFLARTTGWRRVLTVAGALLLVRGTADVARWYYADAAQFAATLSQSGAPPADCLEVLDDPLAEGSHWNLRGNWPTGRTCWGEEFIHKSWTSRGLQDRALRMHRTYHPMPLGRVDLPGGARKIYEIRP
jgi:hypothetical protein